MAIAGGRKWPWGRIVAGAVAAVILGGAVSFLVAGVQGRARADAARIAEPIHLAVDLSRPGSYTGKLNHTFCNAHSDFLEIVTEPPLTSSESAEAIVKGLKGQLTIRGPQGTVVAESSFGPEVRCIQLDDDRWTPVIDFGYFVEGVYDLKLTVNTGAPRLAGVRHSLVGRYRLCGLEYVPAEILWLLGIAGCVLSGVIGLVITVVTVKKRRRPVAD